ncbi:DUF3152 domain-containing protein [Streptomyces sp. RK23]|uniref:DUF3152 domain-containing protein n=1 Tax=unclassified Streptomyces TaxID=2593676 RepID=UPI001B39CC3C|nr:MULTISPECIES: DUF3152 domain-containing protein [unclassified Streptomyces]MBQ0966000.1 DUF3152 domain-containing protein [Streptomyces sp. RK74B]MBQ1005878.1 DUF3152 domain-containing protein [Streptomyces sp. RK23]
MNERRRPTSRPSSAAAGRRRRGGRSRRRRGGRRRLLWPALAAAAVLVLAGGLALRGATESSGGSTDPAGASSSAPPAGSSPAGGTEEGSTAAPTKERETEREKGKGAGKDEREKDGKGAGEKPDPDSIPSSGPGTFATAGGGGDLVGGSGRTLTYVVQVEDGIGIPAQDVAAEVERVLADERGWTADGKVGFRRVSGGASDFRVRLATAGTVDDICGQYGLDTGGEVNCNVGQDVMVNLKRWLLATQYYADDVTSYRALIINHEVGHFLGHGHEGCPGAGRPAPVMMQQIKGLHGCRTNVWPYDADGRAVTGPAVG